MAFGMTAEQRKVMPEREKWLFGMTAEQRKVMPERGSGFWHDGGAEESHAGEGKVAFGMTGERRKVMPERGKWLMA